MIKAALFGQSEWQKQRAVFEAAATDDAKYEALYQMVQLANNHWQARLTLYRVHAFRRPGNSDDTALHREIFAKVMKFSKTLDDRLYGWNFEPNEESHRALGEELYNTARRRDDFHIWKEVCEHMPDRAEEAVRNLIRLMHDGRQASIAISRLEHRSAMRPAFWNAMPRLRLSCGKLLGLHRNWLTDDECERLQQLIVAAKRDISRCPVDYRRICRNADCQIAGGIRN